MSIEDTRIDKNCIIQPGTVIGADGFAYERLEDTLELQRFPHIGGVILSNNVEICSNCSIARGSLSDTIIGERIYNETVIGSYLYFGSMS